MGTGGPIPGGPIRWSFSRGGRPAAESGRAAAGAAVASAVAELVPTTKAASAPVRSSPRRDMAFSAMSPKYSLSLVFGAGCAQASAQRYLHVIALRPPWPLLKSGRSLRRLPPLWVSGMGVPSSLSCGYVQRT
jgi:hypothetical protein